LASLKRLHVLFLTSFNTLCVQEVVNRWWVCSETSTSWELSIPSSSPSENCMLVEKSALLLGSALAQDYGKLRPDVWI
jgi:hypothetical protein